MAREFVLALVLIALLTFAFINSRRSKHQRPVFDAADPAEPFYHAYTTAFDVVCTGAELVTVLAEKAVNAQVSRDASSLDPAERRRRFEEAHQTAAARRLPVSGEMAGAAIVILLDQSGSMAERMPRVAGELLAALELLEAQGATTMMAGFTTVGWKGGRSRQQWLTSGRPSYPGRLCDLLHVVYSSFGQETGQDQIRPLLEQAVCFENVDGEAIVWAEKQLVSLPHERRCLIVVSDGAPVDDSSLSANGPSFLWNHLVLTINGILDRREIAIGGVGIEHSVESLFPVSRDVDGDGALFSALLDVAGELTASEPEKA